MKFNIAPQELGSMISRLKGFASSLSSISGQMRAYSSQLEASWRDPQYSGFVDNVGQMARALKQNEENLTQMAKQLEILKQNLERAHADYNRLSQIK